MATILWFKRDLRIEDNPALALAAAGGGLVLPLYIAEPGLWAGPEASARHWRFVAECLAELRLDLAALGAPLILRKGDAVAVLEALRAAHGVCRLVSHEDTGTQWARDRDRRVADWAAAQGVDWREVPRPGITRGLSHRRGWQAARERAMRAPLSEAPAALPPHGIDPGPIPEAAELGLGFDPCPGRQKGGRAGGLRLLQQAGTGDPSLPDLGADGAVRLSPHLAHGTLSVREAGQALSSRAGQSGAGGHAAAQAARRLAERDRMTQMLASQPDLDCRSLHPAYEGLWPAAPIRLAAWQAGQTGLPFIDACMRQAIQTGWLPFRKRALLVAVASYHLSLDWRITGAYLARLFTDYDPGVHWPQMQIQAGLIGVASRRVADPVKMARALDPTGASIRRWLPELRPVPGAFLHSPWDWARAGRFLGRHYPAPVVDPLRATRIARAKCLAAERSPEFHALRAALMEKHGVRPPPKPKSPLSKATQLSLFI